MIWDKDQPESLVVPFDMMNHGITIDYIPNNTGDV